ncbi:sigma 54-interacting transcriptional regulator [Desulfovibrio ferrophilus]|nr:sigma 54-interacting transcriptional regulator [Desulfovibrio ferrophilus]
MAALIPSVVAILLIAGLANYGVAEQFINVALERFVRLQNLAVAHEVETFLEKCRQDILFAAHGQLSDKSMQDFLQNTAAAGGTKYLEFAYIAPNSDDHIFLYRRDDQVIRASGRDFTRITPNPLLLFGEIPKLKSGEVWISPVMETEHPLPRPGAENTMRRDQIIRFVTPYRMSSQKDAGLIILSIRASDIRDILTLFNSENSPLWAFPRSKELRYDYMIDPDGWMLFQSGEPNQTNQELTTYLARSAYQGTLGRPGLRNAFRPNSEHTRYWDMVQSIRGGTDSLSKVPEQHITSAVHDYYFAFSPVRFNGGGESGPIIYGGIVRVDRSILLVLAGYQYLDVMLVVTVSAILVIALLIYWLGRKLTAPIRMLSEQLNSLKDLENIKEIEIAYGGHDINELKNAVNSMIRRISRQMEEIREKDEAILNVNLREPADLAEEGCLLEEARLSLLPDIIGIGPEIMSLKNNALKAAQVDVDVLVVGETGTGKQLVAEAIHNHGSRKKGPFVSINCGALDENLLLDALFGHVKGAYTEARTDRNGAFHEANGGTLFLDEIQSASPKVQQSLLRALSVRRIKPLGSDTEIPVDVRIIAAANVDLTEMIKEGTFREDLYFRLKVVSIQTPALADHPENIPLLALHYLEQAETLTGRNGLQLSKGAMRRLCAYTWPGNIRELINAITRAAVMAETDVIQAEEIRLEGGLAEPRRAAPTAEEPPPTKQESVLDKATTDSQPTTDLNPRQAKAWPAILKNGGTSRSEYQELVGGNLSPRTANYDLNELVSKDMLNKVGKGPATRYVIPGQE